MPCINMFVPKVPDKKNLCWFLLPTNDNGIDSCNKAAFTLHPLQKWPPTVFVPVRINSKQFNV